MKKTAKVNLFLWKRKWEIGFLFFYWLVAPFEEKWGGAGGGLVVKLFFFFFFFFFSSCVSLFYWASNIVDLFLSSFSNKISLKKKRFFFGGVSICCFDLGFFFCTKKINIISSLHFAQNILFQLFFISC